MTLTASRVEKHPNAPEGTPEKVIVRTTYGPVTNEVVEELGHVKAFHASLGQLIEQIENEGD